MNRMIKTQVRCGYSDLGWFLRRRFGVQNSQWQEEAGNFSQKNVAERKTKFSEQR